MRSAVVVLEPEAPPEATMPAERLRAIVKTHFAFVWRSLRHLGVAERDLDDAAQNVFLVTSRRLDGLEEGKERAFLFGTALRVASRTRRARTRRAEIADDDLAEHADPALAPDEALDRTRAREALVDVLDAMDDDVRAVFVLFEIEQLTMAEIATTLGVAPGTIASRLRRGREQFREGARRVAAKGKIRREP